jgi:uncharacterized protein (UPF0332 family)
MDGSINELSLYRFSKALEDLTAAEVTLRESLYKVSVNRSYYAVFHAMRAVTALKGYDSSKHSGVIAYFNQHFVKTGDFDKESSKIIKNASFLREKSDYEDFYVASKQDAEKQLAEAKIFVLRIEEGSDLDFRIDTDRVRGLFALGGLYADLEDAFGLPVDLLTTTAWMRRSERKSLPRRC